MASQLWLVDRSRISDGRGFCQRARYLNYSSGPTGYGITLKGQKLPLMTGIGAHDGVAPIMEWVRDHITTPQQARVAVERYEGGVPAEVVRAAIKGAQDAYWKTVDARGFSYMKDEPGVAELTREQCYLISGLIWAWVLEVLPEVIMRGRVVEVEHDDTYVLSCTCGLGDGILSKADHEARECSGIGLQCRPDFIVETWETKELEYHEFKTTGADNQTFRDKWEVMMQMFAATLDVERRLGKPVGWVYVHGLLKGKREGEYNPATRKRDGVYRQASLLVYGYRKPANPPMEREDWQPKYDYVDADGANRRLGKGYEKCGVWELPDPQDHGVEGMDRSEWWVKALPSDVRRSQLILLGPFVRQEIMVPHFLEEMIGEEQRVREGCWQVYNAVQQELLSGATSYWAAWSQPSVQRELDRQFPRSYECRRYGERSRCQFENICFEREGWSAPLDTGMYVMRRPHHSDELAQMAERGLLPPEEGLAEEAGE